MLVSIAADPSTLAVCWRCWHCALAWLPWDCARPRLHVLDVIRTSLSGLVLDLCCHHGLAWWCRLVATSGAAPLPDWGGQISPAGLEIPILWGAASSCCARTGKSSFILLLKVGQSSLDQPWCVNMMLESFWFGGFFFFFFFSWFFFFFRRLFVVLFLKSCFEKSRSLV